MLKDRLRLAMDGPPRVPQVDLARACGVSGPTVNDWLSGKTQTIKGPYLLACARYLGVSADWLATGKGPMRSLSESAIAAPQTDSFDLSREEQLLLLAYRALSPADKHVAIRVLSALSR